MGLRKKIARLMFSLRHSKPVVSKSRGIELRIPSDPAFLRLLRSTITSLCALAGFGRRDSSKIVLAVDEACTNVMRHAYNNQTGKPIFIACEIQSEFLVITIVDLGEPADLRSIKSRPLHDIRPGGLGVYIIRSVMDEVRYENLADIGNRVVMCKHLPLLKGS